MKQSIPLEQQAREVSTAASRPPLIFKLPVEQGRMTLERAQDMPVYQYPARVSRISVDTRGWGTIPLYMVDPGIIGETADVIFYLHGAGWVFGSFHTHEKLVRELAARTGSIVLFPEYSRAPEAQFPVALEQCCSLLSMAPELTAKLGYQMNPHTLTIAGDSAGGNLAIALTLMARQRRGPRIQKQLLYYPVTDACFQTPSYCQFAQGYYLYRAGMEWFWDQYVPCSRDRRRITASPLRAEPHELKGLPAALIINGQADVLRDEGQAYGVKLREAGVDVTLAEFPGMIHDFVMLHSLDDTNACRAAMDLSVSWIKRLNFYGEKG